MALRDSLLILLALIFISMRRSSREGCFCVCVALDPIKLIILFILWLMQFKRESYKFL